MPQHIYSNQKTDWRKQSVEIDKILTINMNSAKSLSV